MEGAKAKLGNLFTYYSEPQTDKDSSVAGVSSLKKLKRSESESPAVQEAELVSVTALPLQ